MPKVCGTRAQYLAGCRCDECRYAQARYQQQFRDAKINGELPGSPFSKRPSDAGPCELAVYDEVAGLAQAESRPTLVQAAMALARILDNPRAPGPQPAAAKQLAELMNQLRKGADARKSRLASVKEMTKPQVKAV